MKMALMTTRQTWIRCSNSQIFQQKMMKKTLSSKIFHQRNNLKMEMKMSMVINSMRLTLGVSKNRWELMMRSKLMAKRRQRICLNFSSLSRGLNPSQMSQMTTGSIQMPLQGRERDQQDSSMASLQNIKVMRRSRKLSVNKILAVCNYCTRKMQRHIPVMPTLSRLQKQKRRFTQQTTLSKSLCQLMLHLISNN